MKPVRLFFLLLLTCLAFQSLADDGYRLWLRYDLIQDATKLNSYRQNIRGYLAEGDSKTLLAIREELSTGLKGLLGTTVPEVHGLQTGGLIFVTSGSPLLSGWKLKNRLTEIGDEGFIIANSTIQGKKTIVVAANTDIGLLYGAFYFLRLLQTQQEIINLTVVQAPSLKLRILNHWDNLDGTVERGYAGFSIWNWHKLPEYLDPRYKDYARANASVGINGAVLTNVNANALILTPFYLEKVAALASVFRPYGIKVYLSARFSAPIEIGNLKTADPLDRDVKQWWKAKADEIYKYIPDFGGFVVKANSEGQPGPQNYNRTHADGANMLADALVPYRGVVMWRAFVYDDKVPDDRAKQAYNEFKPLDGTFRANVLVQVKNGAIDFQPREPFHPLFGAMPATPLMMEFQITQEYLGFSTHLVYLGPMFKETLSADTYSNGKGSLVQKIVDGSQDKHTLSGMAGVANIGSDRNWCGHPFAQANWYAYGRLAWNPDLGADQIADEWIRMTFSNQREVVSTLKPMMMSSRETCVDYMTPLGLHHIMGWSHHYGPGPWIKNKRRADWTSVYYHRADSAGIGFDRTITGSNAIGQYAPEVQKQFGIREVCPDKFLLWFHHVKWNDKLKSEETLWNSLCRKYNSGVDSVRLMQKSWKSLEGKIDDQRFKQISMLLSIQEQEAVWWRDACLSYFQTFSHQPIPDKFEKPKESLDYYMKLEFPYAPGIRPQW